MVELFVRVVEGRSQNFRDHQQLLIDKQKKSWVFSCKSSIDDLFYLPSPVGKYKSPRDTKRAPNQRVLIRPSLCDDTREGLCSRPLNAIHAMEDI